jgi:hypothetical protein
MEKIIIKQVSVAMKWNARMISNYKYNVNNEMINELTKQQQKQ